MARAELLLLLCERRKEGEARTTEWREWSGAAGRRPDQGEGVVGRGAPNAGVRPPLGRRGMGRGGRRAREREWRGRQAGLLAGPKGRRGWPSSACPLFYFFGNSFLNFFLNLFGLFKNHFHPFPPKAKLFQNKNPTTLF